MELTCHFAIKQNRALLSKRNLTAIENGDRWREIL
jgi:hypothetical protein